jgi:hypothetical protein
VFQFLIPVSKTASEMKRKMNEFQNSMQDKGFVPKQDPVKEPVKEKAGDYIDFEEVK